MTVSYTFMTARVSFLHCYSLPVRKLVTEIRPPLARTPPQHAEKLHLRDGPGKPGKHLGLGQAAIRIHNSAKRDKPVKHLEEIETP